MKTNHLMKMVMLLAFMLSSIGSAWAQKAIPSGVDFSSPSKLPDASWDNGTKVYSTKTGWNNVMRILEFDKGTLSNFDNYRYLHLNVQNAVSSQDIKFRILFMEDGDKKTQIECYSDGDKWLDLTDQDATKNADLSGVNQIGIAGYGTEGTEGSFTLDTKSIFLSDGKVTLSLENTNNFGFSYFMYGNKRYNADKGTPVSAVVDITKPENRIIDIISDDYEPEGDENNSFWCFRIYGGPSNSEYEAVYSGALKVYDDAYDNRLNIFKYAPNSNGVLTVKADYANILRHYVNAEKGGKATMSAIINNQFTEVPSGYKTTPWPWQGIKYVATPDFGYNFDGWYDKNGNKVDGSKITHEGNNYIYIDQPGGEGADYTAKFTIGTTVEWQYSDDKHEAKFTTGTGSPTGIVLNPTVNLDKLTMTVGNGAQTFYKDDWGAFIWNASGQALGVGFQKPLNPLGLNEYTHQTPNSGTYYTIKPLAPGKLYISGSYDAGNDMFRAYLVDATDGYADLVVWAPTKTGVYNIVYGDNGTGVPNSPIYLRAGHTYYLYSSEFNIEDYPNHADYGINNSASSHFSINGIKFEPFTPTETTTTWDFRNNAPIKVDSGKNYLTVNDGSEAEPYTGLKFHSVRLYKSTGSGADVINNGYIEIPAQAGDVIKITGISDNASNYPANFSITNGTTSDGANKYFSDHTGGQTAEIIATGSPVRISMANHDRMWIDAIELTHNGYDNEIIWAAGDMVTRNLSVFLNEDGSEVKDDAGKAIRYRNWIGNASPVKEGGTWTYTSSNWRDVAPIDNNGTEVGNVSGSTNVIPLAPKQEGATIVTAIVNKDDKEYFGQYTLNLINMRFKNKEVNVTIPATGTLNYFQQVVGIPSNSHVKYEITTGSDIATISVDEATSMIYNLAITKPGDVKIKATLLKADGTVDSDVNDNPFTAELTLHVTGAYLEIANPVVPHNTGSYTPKVLDQNGNQINDFNGWTWTIRQDDTSDCFKSATVANNGTVTLPTGRNIGGIVVVNGKKNDGAEVEYCLTVAYDTNVWDTYSDPLHFGSVVEGDWNDQKGFDNNTPGSAHYVIHENNGYGSGYNRVSYNQMIENNKLPDFDLYAKERWYNTAAKVMTFSNSGKRSTVNYELLRRHWGFTYKTCQYNSSRTQRIYVNEPLFAYKRSINGDNGRIVKETRGLIFKSRPMEWGVSDNDLTNEEGASQVVRESDRCILMKTNTTMTVPYVKAGYFVRLHWYRHSDNNGDCFTAQNAMDLDGKVINPNDWIRFTGSHYYGHKDEPDESGVYGHKGSTIFYIPTKAELQAAGDPYSFADNYTTDGDGKECVNFTVTMKNGWAEIYRVEVMDYYKSELKVCQVDVFEETGKQLQGQSYTHRATIDQYNARDLNKVDNYNMTDHNQVAANLVSRITTYANGATLVKNAPDLYINGYAGNCYCWNGWQNMKLEVIPDAGSTLHYTEGSEGVAVGARITYNMMKLSNISGTGSARLALKNMSGSVGGGQEYCLNKMEAYIAVGEYSVQNYPYTWDFTDYNTDLTNAYNEKTLVKMTDGSRNKLDENYGNWQSPVNATWAMHAYKNDYSNYITRGAGMSLVRDADRRNKPFFAQGAQLSQGHRTGDNKNSKHTILETEGLRFNLTKVSKDNNADVMLVAGGQSGDKAYGDNGCLKVKAGTKITIPEVDKDMYVFVAGTVAPSATTNTKVSDTTFEPNVKKYNGDALVTYYQATGAADGGKADIELSFAEDATLYKIGVTNQKKAISYFGWSTESRAVDIDYNETRYFSADVESFYVHDATNWNHRSDNFNLETDLEVRLQGTSEGVDDRLYIPQGTGIVMHNNDCIYDSKVSEDADAGKSYVVPLFVNACNVPQTNTDNYKNNILVASTNKDKENTTIYTSLESDNEQYYTMSNYYVGAKLEDNAWSTGKFYTTTPRFYRYIGAGGGSSSKELKNMSFLKVEKPQNVKIMNDIISVDFGYGVETDPTAIEIVGWDGNEINNGIYYNLRGQAINGKPSVPGIYIKDGKKYYVK